LADTELMHDPFEYFHDDLLLEIGKITLLRANLNFQLLGLADHLLTTRPGDQGIAKLLNDSNDTVALLKKLISFGQVRKVSPHAISILVKALAEYAPDFQLAAQIASSAWTFLGGSKERWYGSFKGQNVKESDLAPQWDDFTVAKLGALRDRLTSADKQISLVRGPFLLASAMGRVPVKPKKTRVAK
jgi:hypothetical protein